MYKAGLAFAAFGAGNVDIMCGVKSLRLGAGFNLVIKEINRLATLHPIIVDKQRSGTVIAMTVDGPVSEENGRPLGLQDREKTVILFPVQFGGSVDLTRKEG